MIRRLLYPLMAVAAFVACGPADEEVPASDPPVVRMMSPLLAPVLTPVTFDASETSDDNGVVYVKVQFGDGSAEEAFSSLIFSHTYQEPATYEVRVEAIDTEDNSDVLERNITVVDRYMPPYCGEDLPCEMDTLCIEGECFYDGQ